MELLLATEFAAKNQKVKAAQITVHAGVLLDEKQDLVILKQGHE
jgi:hypothetical protein